MRSGRKSIPLQGVFFVMLFVAVLYVLFPKLLPGIFTSVASPFWDFEKDIRGGNITVSAELENSLISELLRENEELKSILGRTSSSTPILAYILKKPPFTAYDGLILDVGYDDGIDVGYKVYAVGDILLGEVTDTQSKTSKVKLYSSQGEKYDVSINDSAGEYTLTATALGRGGGTFEASLPRDIKVKEGDIITIPNLSPSVFGIVKEVIADPARTFSTVLFSQPVNIFEQKWVLIYRPDESSI